MPWCRGAVVPWCRGAVGVFADRLLVGSCCYHRPKRTSCNRCQLTMPGHGGVRIIHRRSATPLCAVSASPPPFLSLSLSRPLSFTRTRVGAVHTPPSPPTTNNNAGPPTRMQENPEGSWSCTACDNVNWPLRSACKRCNLAKGGAPGMQMGVLTCCTTCLRLNKAPRFFLVVLKATKRRCGASQMHLQQPVLLENGQLVIEPQPISVHRHRHPHTSTPSHLHTPTPSTHNHARARTGMGMGMGMGMGGASCGSEHPPGSWNCPGCRNV